MTNTADLGGDTLPRPCCFFVDLSISDQSIVGPISANIVFFQCEKTKKRQSKVCAYPL